MSVCNFPVINTDVLVCVDFVFTHGQLGQRCRHTDGGQEDVGRGIAACQSSEQVVAEVGGGGTQLSCWCGEELDMFLLHSRLLALRLETGQRRVQILLLYLLKYTVCDVTSCVRNQKQTLTLMLWFNLTFTVCDVIPEPDWSSAGLHTSAGRLFSSSCNTHTHTRGWRRGHAFITEPFTQVFLLRTFHVHVEHFKHGLT